MRRWCSADHRVAAVFKWVKGDLIGKGTYGRVYLALNATTGEMIAVKQVELPTTASDREDVRQKGMVTALKAEISTLKDLVATGDQVRLLLRPCGAAYMHGGVCGC